MPRKLEDMVQKKSAKREIKIEKVSRPKEAAKDLEREAEREIEREAQRELKRSAPSEKSKALFQERLKEKIEDVEMLRDDSLKRSSNVNKKAPHSYRVWIVAIIAIIFFLFALSFMFSKVFITIDPKMKDVTLAEHLTGTKDSTQDNVSYDLVVISGDETAKVPAGEEKDVAVKARGTAIIYNNFSSASQPLDIDTRLEGSNGKIYKTEKKITVPGISGGKPGSVEVGIYGAEAGAEYNSEPLDFKIFGFKGTPKYDKFYARGKGSITGGLKGKLPVVSEEEQAKAATDLKNTLQAKLSKKAADQIPSGFILFKDAVFLNAGEPVIDYTKNEEGTVPVTLKGTLYGFIFDEAKLTKQIAKDTIDKFDNSPVYIPNIKDLSFNLANKENISFADAKNIDFTLSGPAKIVWKFDQNKFLTDILGISKGEFNQTLAKYPNIKSAEMHLRPFWRSSLPGDVKDVDLTINYPK
jgi:hypothetical protein